MKLRYPCPTRGTATGLLNWGLIHVSASIRALRSIVTCLGLRTTRLPDWTRSKELELHKAGLFLVAAGKIWQNTIYRFTSFSAWRGGQRASHKTVQVTSRDLGLGRGWDML